MLPMKKYRRRPRLTKTEKSMMWDRWLQGDSLHAIARLLDTSHTSIRRHLVATGGIRPLPRKRSNLALSLSEREEISRGIGAGHSIRSIATL
jgi:IS30 family transposase